MYRQIIIDRFKNPRYRGELSDPDIAYGDVNILCGDELTYYIKLNENNEISNVRFSGKGCTISLASADLLAEALEEMTLEEVKELENDFVFQLLGISVTPTRTKCAILSLKVVQAGINIFEEFGKIEATKSLREKGKTLE
jgi:nitrogen fixation NifU-like protein